MKRLTLLLFSMIILAFVVAGCDSPSQEDTIFEDAEMQQEEADATQVETPSDAQVDTALEETEVVTPTDAQADAAVDETEVVTPTDAQAGAAVEETEVVTPTDAQAGAAVEETEALTPTDAQAGAAVEGAEMIPATGAVNLNRISNLLDFEVWNGNNEQIGDVNAMVINQDSSQIEYVIVGIGGFLGIGEQDLPVPWPALELRGAAEEMEAEESPQNIFVLNMSAEELEQAPDFDLTPLYDSEEAVESTSLEQLEQDIYAFWQNEQMTQTSGPKHLIPAEELLDASIQQTSEESVGQVEEIMVDVDTGKVTYLLVSLDASAAELMDEGGEVEESAADTAQEPSVEAVPMTTIPVIPVPLTAVAWDPEEETLFYTGGEALVEAPIVHFEDIESDGSIWKSQADSFWGLTTDDAEMQDADK